jgi:hypothetical protein
MPMNDTPSMTRIATGRPGHRNPPETHVPTFSTAPSAYSRAVTVHARMLEIFEQIDARLVEAYLEAGNHSPGYVMHDGRR